MRRPIMGLQNAPFLPRSRRNRRFEGGTMGTSERLGRPATDRFEDEQTNVASELSNDKEGAEGQND